MPGPKGQGLELKLRPDVLVRAVREDFVMVDLDQGGVYHPNATGGHILGLLADGATVDDMVASLVTRFQVEDSAARADVETFVERLRAKSLVASVEV